MYMVYATLVVTSHDCLLAYVSMKFIKAPGALFGVCGRKSKPKGSCMVKMLHHYQRVQ